MDAEARLLMQINVRLPFDRRLAVSPVANLVLALRMLEAQRAEAAGSWEAWEEKAPLPPSSCDGL